ncbi:MAG: hypothetical protein ABSB19_04630 [Methylomonas sp.]|jgi:hypothetical protein
MTDPIALPFLLTEKSLAVWLEQLEELPPGAAAIKLHDVLYQLSKNHQGESWKLYPILPDLGSKAFFLANILIEKNSSATELMLDSKSIKFAKLALDILKQAATLFARLAKEDRLELAQRQTANYYALQLIGYSQRNFDLIYQIPSSRLWKETAVLYKLAIETNSLKTLHNTVIPAFSSQPNILSVIKRNLLFSLFEPTRYRHDEIKEFFNLSNKHFDLLDINPDYLSDSGFYWDQENKPLPINASKHYAATDVIKIDCHRFVLGLKNGSVTTSLANATKYRLILQLTGYKQVFGNLERGSHVVSKLLVGYARISQYLQGLDKSTKINALSNKFSPINIIQTNLTLQPMEHESPFYHTRKVSWHSSFPGAEVNLIQKDNYIVVITDKDRIAADIGDLSLIYNNENSFSFAIVRKKVLNEMLLGELSLLEPIADNYSIYTFKNAENILQAVIIINENSENPEAFLPRANYKINAKILLNAGTVLHLLACLEYNESFCRFKIRL